MSCNVITEGKVVFLFLSFLFGNSPESDGFCSNWAADLKVTQNTLRTNITVNFIYCTFFLLIQVLICFDMITDSKHQNVLIIFWRKQIRLLFTTKGYLQRLPLMSSNVSWIVIPNCSFKPSFAFAIVAVLMVVMTKVPLITVVYEAVQITLCNLFLTLSWRCLWSTALQRWLNRMQKCERFVAVNEPSDHVS